MILMQKSFKDVEFLTLREFDENEFITGSSMEPFFDGCVVFLNALSKILIRDKRTRNYPDVATFAFYCRKANILKLKKQYSFNNKIKLGKGVVFHVAPSNVPVNFAYSLVSALLAGNINIVRVPSKNFEQVQIICDAINSIGKEEQFEEIYSKIALIRYDRKNNATAYFSSICDVRIIWGGDETIVDIRKNKLPPRSFDVTFADRYSLCVINADEYVNEETPEVIAQAFYNDTYLFDQNACTAPHLILWLGNKSNIKLAKINFWKKLHEYVKTKYVIQPVISVDKLTSFYFNSTKMKETRRVETPDNLIWRVELRDLEKDINLYRCTSGYFAEYNAKSLSELSGIITRRYQTLSYYGLNKDVLAEFILNEKPNGIDRIVPIGRTSDFSLTWDGYDLIETLSRTIEIN